MNIRRIKNIVATCRQIAFPEVCVCCGMSVFGSRKLLCDGCRLARFAQPDIRSGTFMPSSVPHHYSLLTFDKGGYLQQLLNKLKYQHLSNLGRELGQYLGNSYLESPEYHYSDMDRLRGFILIPVPLHKKKQRKRGYNQARVIAEGIASATGWKVVPEQMLIRSKNTKTQTGLTTKERSENVREVFEWGKIGLSNKEIPVLVDDVFTTGATAFELADMVMKKTDEKSIILTIAKA